jgi:soluble lytic murein transglycosylase-like protein
LVPPAAVLIISIMMFGFLSQVRNTSAATPTRSQADGLQTNPRHNTIAAFFAPEVHYWESRIVSWSEEWNLDPNLVATVMQIESCGDPKALSGSGAMGLFQVMPYHFIDNENPYKPKVNARRGLNYLKNALESGGGDLRLALAGYNGGITGAKRPESDWSAQMNRYVYWGTGIYQDAVNGGEQSDRLDEWLAAGGASLCRQAAKNIGDLR